MGESLKAAYNALLNSGYQLSPGAFQLLKETQNPESLVSALLRQLESLEKKPVIIERSHLEPLISKGPLTAPSPPTRAPQPHSIQVISGSEGQYIEGTIHDFRRYFMDRFNRLKEMLKSRADMRDAVTPSSMPEVNRHTKVKVIGMVSSKKEFKNGGAVLELEDDVDTIRVSFRGDELKKKVSRVMLDEVICVFGTTSNGKSVFAEDIVWPDVPPKIRSPRSKNDVYVVLTSDLHIGSKLFMRQQFESFLKWLRGEDVGAPQREIAGKIRYLIIAGDVVDGVGVYPNQEDELLIKDLNKQYEEAAHYLSMVPDHIKIIIIPGNHDASRPTLPSPPIYRDFGAPLYSLKNVIMLGDPAVVNIEGVTFLLTHGKSLDDVIPALPDCNFKEPQKAMVELLKSRHLAPIYGEKTSLAPEPRDSLIIDPVPDVFHAGHVHVWGISEYRGILAVNSGTWQKQTNYQLSMGIEPAPGVVPLINLANFKVTTLNFL
ncbi:MAG: DNA-directed DNA polymerase II small subunit [Candidatus Methanomethylicaceae archaeon]|nr:DNA-directed DNA polymerase II small subunit [Candidatus Verstraetearchaeota archaeon]